MSILKKKEQQFDENKAKKKFVLKKKSIVIIMSIVVIFLTIIACYIIHVCYVKMNELTFENYKLYQYFSGIKFSYDGTVALKRNGDITKIDYNNLKVETDNTPIYFEEVDNEVLFPENMALIFPRIKNQSYKINYFSKIVIEKDSVGTEAFLVSNKKKMRLDTAFIYDGNNMYFFLEETKVVIDGITYKLSPLSYIIVNYKSEIDIYDKKSDKYTIIDSSNNDVVASVDKYKVDLSTDMIIYDDANRLLIKNVSNLPTYKGN